MQKIIRVIAPVFFVLAFLSCSQEPIFYSIEREIKLKEPSLKNIVYSVVEFLPSSDLYAANGKISLKSNGSNDWRRIDAPGFTIRLAADNSGMYALTQITEDERSAYAVWYSADPSAGSWALVSGLTGTVSTICDNQARDANRAAFAVTSEGVFLLENGAAGAKQTANDAGKDVKAAAYKTGTGEGTWFSTVQGFTAANDYLYRMNDGSAQSSIDGVTWNSIGGISSRRDTSAAAVYEYPDNSGQKYLLVGTTSGARAIKLDETGGFSGGVMEIPMGTNAAASLNNSQLFAGGLYVFGDLLYAATANGVYPDRNGLWQYFSDKNVWDRE